MKYKVFTKVQREDIPEATRIVHTKWVYLVKRRADGSVEKHKARKVGRGFTQQEGINYGETYAQMMRPETFKILLVIALQSGMGNKTMGRCSSLPPSTSPT